MSLQINSNSPGWINPQHQRLISPEPSPPPPDSPNPVASVETLLSSPEPEAEPEPIPVEDEDRRSRERSYSCKRAFSPTDEVEEPNFKKASNVPTYHDCWSDPAAEAVFASSDGVLFRVSMHNLRRTCGWFQFRKIEETDPPLELDLNTHDLHKFLCILYREAIGDILDKGKPSKTLSLPQADQLLSIAEQFQAEYLSHHLRNTLVYRASRDPWEALRIATRREDDELARAAVRGFRITPDNELEDLTKLTRERFEGVSSRYMFEILRLRGCVPAKREEKKGVNWDWIAENFAPGFP